MKNIIVKIFPCIVVALFLASCDSTMDSKDSIDEKYFDKNLPQVVLGEVTQPKFSDVLATANLIDAEKVIEAGFVVTAELNDFSNAISNIADIEDGQITAIVSGLSEKTTYYVYAYACTKASGVVYSEPKQITTPEAPALTVQDLDGKIYVKNNVVDYWGDSYNIQIQLAYNPKDPECNLFVYDIDPYFVANGLDHTMGYQIYPAKFVLNSDKKSGVITIAQGTPTGYPDTYLYGFADEELEEFGDLKIDVLNNGATLSVTNAFGIFDGTFEAWSLYLEPFVLKAK